MCVTLDVYVAAHLHHLVELTGMFWEVSFDV